MTKQTKFVRCVVLNLAHFITGMMLLVSSQALAQELGPEYLYESGTVSRLNIPSRWLLDVDALALSYDAEDEYSFATDVANLELYSGDLNAEFDAGIKVRVGYQLARDLTVEGVYLGNVEWSDQLQGGTGGALANISESTKFQNMELNLLADVSTLQYYASLPIELTSLIGVRHSRIDQEFVNGFGTQANNELTGLQIGLLSEFVRSPQTWISLDIKGAVFHNDLGLSSTGGTVSGVNVIGGRTSEDRTTWGGDVSLEYHYQFAPAWTLEIGYQLHWYSGVALAARNAQNNLGLGAVGLDHSGNILFQGPTFGLAWVR